MAGIRELMDASHHLACAARELWEAHVKSNGEKPSPLRYGMNYGELVKLKQALDAYDKCALLSVLRANSSRPHEGR